MTRFVSIKGEKTDAKDGFRDLPVNEPKECAALFLKQFQIILRDCLFHDEGNLKLFKYYTTSNCMLECSWKVSFPSMLQKFLITFHLISFHMPRKQKTFVAVVLGTFPQKTAPPCAGSSVASVSTRCFPLLFLMFNLQFFLGNGKDQKQKAGASVRLQERLCTVSSKEKNQSLKTCKTSDVIDSKFNSYINLPASHINIF